MDVDELKQLLQQYLLTPLNNLPITHLKALDANHDQSVQDFQDALSLLFGPGAKPFQGQAADAIADYVNSYLDAEEALSPYGGGGLSDRINTLLNKCAGVLEQEEPLMKAVRSNGAWEIATGVVGQQEQQVDESLPPDPEDPFWDLIQIFLIMGGVAVFVWASADQSNKVQDLVVYMNMWVNDMQTLAQQPDPPGSQLPDLPSQITQAVVFDTEQIVANSVDISLTPEQERLVQTLAGEYGLSVEEIAELLALDPTISEAELRKRIERYLQLRQQYPKFAASNPQWLLWAAGLGLTDSMVAFLANLNNGKTTVYLKGDPLKDVAADVLAAVLGQLTQEASDQLRKLVQQARAAKAKGIPLDEAIPGWDDLPADVKRLLDWKPSYGNYGFQYGNAIESLVEQNFNAQYGSIESFYAHFSLKFNKTLFGGKLRPDYQITIDGHTDILDITSLKNAPTKVKYDIDGVDIIIVLTYGG